MNKLLFTTALILLSILSHSKDCEALFANYQMALTERNKIAKISFSTLNEIKNLMRRDDKANLCKLNNKANSFKDRLLLAYISVVKTGETLYNNCSDVLIDPSQVENLTIKYKKNYESFKEIYSGQYTSQECKMLECEDIAVDLKSLYEKTYLAQNNFNYAFSVFKEAIDTEECNKRYSQTEEYYNLGIGYVKMYRGYANKLIESCSGIYNNIYIESYYKKSTKFSKLSDYLDEFSTMTCLK